MQRYRSELLEGGERNPVDVSTVRIVSKALERASKLVLRTKEWARTEIAATIKGNVYIRKRDLDMKFSEYSNLEQTAVYMPTTMREEYAIKGKGQDNFPEDSRRGNTPKSLDILKTALCNKYIASGNGVHRS